MVLRIMPAWRRRRDSVPVVRRRVLITGGSSGIGLACARRLARAGARVVLLARGDEALRLAAASCEPMPETIAADVTDPDAMRAAVARAAHLLGGLDAVVANAGAAAYGPFTEMDAGDYRQTIDTTLVGVLNTAHAALPHLERGGGTFVVVGSIAGRVPTPWLAAYTPPSTACAASCGRSPPSCARCAVRCAWRSWRPVRSIPLSGAAPGRRTGDCRRGCSAPTVRPRLRPRWRVPLTARESSVPSAR
jgi:NADP-dependent 3-hydroxy acid dehydrogenase YdfG